MAIYIHPFQRRVEIGSTDTGRHSMDDYKYITNEFVVPHSTAKYTKHNRESYMVGALARFNLNSEKLLTLAKECGHKFGLRPITYNPFMNNVAQLIELAHSMEGYIALIDKLFNIGIRQETLPGIDVIAGRGIGVVEVPRGILFHDYTYNSQGRCVNANCTIPTNQNHNNIKKDMEAFAPTFLEKPEKEIELNLEMLVRAYDPCISCSTHWI